MYEPVKSGKKRVILGLMTFGPDKDAGGRVSDLEEFKAVLDDFQSHGYNEVDTAYGYVGTKQQAFTRDAGWKERGLHLATKFYPGAKQGGHDKANLREKCLWNNEQLGTDCVDIFYLHAPDRNTDFTETLEECNNLYKEGRFKQLGLSNYTAYEVAEIVTICRERGWVKPTIYQGMYNAITRNLETETIIACHRYGLDVVVYNPLAGGLFAGKVQHKDELPADEHSRFGKHSHAGEAYRKRYFRDSTFEAMEMIKEVAKKHDLTTIEIGLRWVMHHSALNVAENGGDGIIIGVSSKKHLESNLADLEKGPLPDEVVEVLDKAWIHAKPLSIHYWHGELKYGYEWK